ncbi:putative flavonol synthase [Helianthus annuus]|nr:putative flavonol synthase [Helianthus annuus]
MKAVNHGLSESYLDIIRQVSKQFLELPLEEKKKYYREAGSSEGYGNDVTVSESQVQDWCDRLFLLLLPKDQRKLQFWPENPSNFRFLLYPPCPTPDQVLGLKAHSDKSGITFLLQDPEVEGLQVFNDGKWYMVPVIRDALFINLGDQMQVTTYSFQTMLVVCTST